MTKSAASKVKSADLKSPPRRLYFVVRVSKLNAADAIDELDAVINRVGYAWFGKFGRPMGKPQAQAQGDARLVILQAHVSSGHVTSYKLRTYAIKAFSKQRPKDKAFPDYYSEFIGRITTWVQVEKVWAENITIGELTVISSYQPLRNALRGSMSSHFICWKRD